MKLSALASLGLNIHVHCQTRACWRMAVLGTREMIDQVGDIELDELAARLRCRKCGARPHVSPRRDPPSPPIRG